MMCEDGSDPFRKIRGNDDCSVIITMLYSFESFVLGSKHPADFMILLQRRYDFITDFNFFPLYSSICIQICHCYLNARCLTIRVP
ncbi:hypothetical protein D3C78_1067070 [compost metagenome]